MILPMALAAAGNAQQLTCWYLKPAENDRSALESYGLRERNDSDKNEDERLEDDAKPDENLSLTNQK